MEPLEPKPKAAEVSVESGPPQAPSAKVSYRDEAWETVRSLLIVLAAVFCIRTFVAEATVIPTGSMENTILIGDHVFLDKLLYGPRLPYTSLRIPPLREAQRQEIVAFRYPRNPSVMFVKRVIAKGGDVLRVENKRVFVNGKPLNEPYVRFQSPSIFLLRDNFPPTPSQLAVLPAAWGLDPTWAREMPKYLQSDGLHVPQGYLFVMGDNRDNSLDSRFWGFVPESYVVGEPLFVYWSYKAPTEDWITDNPMARAKFDFSILWNFVRNTRWSRMGKFF